MAQDLVLEGPQKQDDVVVLANLTQNLAQTSKVNTIYSANHAAQKLPTVSQIFWINARKSPDVPKNYSDESQKTPMNQGLIRKFGLVPRRTAPHIPCFPTGRPIVSHGLSHSVPNDL